jgi:hypothetical protein
MRLMRKEQIERRGVGGGKVRTLDGKWKEARGKRVGSWRTVRWTGKEAGRVIRQLREPKVDALKDRVVVFLSPNQNF